jgi:hypothetical protein
MTISRDSGRAREACLQAPRFTGGAYHFLSAGDPSTPPREWGAEQAKTFVKVIGANNALRKTRPHGASVRCLKLSQAPRSPRLTAGPRPCRKVIRSQT